MGPPHTPRLNRVAERFNRTLLDRILPSLLQANLPIKFWEDCARHYLASINLSPTRANENSVAPETLWSSKPSLYKRLRAFGCRVFRLITGPARGGKLTSKSDECIHLYSLQDRDGWMVWYVHLKQAVKTHDAVFHKDSFPGVGNVSQRTADHWVSWSVKTSTPVPNHSIFSPPFSSEQQSSTPLADSSEEDNSSPSQVPLPEATVEEDLEPRDRTPPHPASPPIEPDTPQDASDDIESSPSPPPPALRRGTRERKTTERYGFLGSACKVSQALFDQNLPLLGAMVAKADPQSFQEAT